MNILEITMQVFSICLIKTSLLSNIYVYHFYFLWTISNYRFLKKILNQISPLLTFLHTCTFSQLCSLNLGFRS